MRNSGGAAPVHGIRQVTFGGTNGVLWPQKYNLLGKSCNAGQCHPGFFFVPKLPWKGASVQNAQHYSSKEHIILTGASRASDCRVCRTGFILDCVYRVIQLSYNPRWRIGQTLVPSGRLCWFIYRNLSETLSACPITGGKKKHRLSFFRC